MKEKLPPLVLDARSRGGRPLICGHRGSRAHAPENTMAGFARAVALGADLIELDVRLTRDGEMVIIHDATVDRTTDGTGRVDERTWEEMRALDAGVRYGASFAGERFPSLGEVLDWARGRVYLAVEVKVPPPLDPAVLVRIAVAIAAAGMADQVTMHYIPQPDISAVHTVDPAMQILCDWSATVRDLPGAIRRTAALGGAGVIWSMTEATAAMVAQARDAGLAVYANECPPTPADVREARSRGIAILEADDVAAMAAAVAASDVAP